MATNNSINSRELIKTNNLSDLTNAGTARTNLGLGSAAVVATDLADLNESTIEAAIDTLANLTSIQGRTITLADAGANAIFGWDDVAGAYENLTQAEARTVLGLGTAAYVATDLADLNEATIESAIDTLANLTSIQGRTVTLADAGANAVFGWDDVAGAYENLTASEVRGAIGLATSDSPQFTGIELGHATQNTLSASAGILSIEGVAIPTISSTDTLSNKTLTAPKFADLGYIADANGNELIILDTVTSAVNEITLANAATGNNPTFTASGGDANVGIDLTPKGTGFVQIKGNSTQAGTLAIYEDTDDGSNYSAFRGSARSGNIIYTLPTADPTAGQVLSAGAPSGGVSALSWATAGGGGGGWAFESYNTATNSASITVSSLDLETDLAYQVVYETIADSGTNHEVQMTFGGTGAGTYVFGLSWQKQVGATSSNGSSGSNSLGYWRLQTETTRSCQGTLLLTKGTNTTGEPLIMMRGSTGGYSTDTALTTSVSGVNEATTVTSITLTASAGTPNWKVWIFRAATS